MAENNHFTSFSVQNFKCFEAFELDNIGQFNLIVGDNNVGKTSILEALLLEEDLLQSLSNLLALYSLKHNYADTRKMKEVDYFSFFVHHNRDNSINYKVNGITEIALERHNLSTSKPSVLDQFRSKYPGSNLTGDVIVKLINGLPADICPMNFTAEKRLTSPSMIPNNLGFTNRVIADYADLKQKDLSKSKDIINLLRLMAPSLVDLHSLPNGQGDSFLYYQQEGINNLLPITSLGDGSLKLLRIILRILTSSSKKLMIDEIDTGIHYSRMKDYIKVIIQACRKENIQLFATTHSKELIESFSQAFAELGEDFQQEFRYIILGKTKESFVKSYVLNYEQLRINLSAENQVR